MTKHGTILLVEDNMNNVVLVRKAFAEAQIQQPLQVIHSGEEAIKYLSGTGKYADRTSYPIPSMVMLDLKMRGDDGFMVLRWLYERPGLRKKFVVIVLSGNSSDYEVQLAYELGAQSFLRKPQAYEQLVGVVRRLKEYWIDFNRMPGDPV